MTFLAKHLCYKQDNDDRYQGQGNYLLYLDQYYPGCYIQTIYKHQSIAVLPQEQTFHFYIKSFNACAKIRIFLKVVFFFKLRRFSINNKEKSRAKLALKLQICKLRNADCKRVFYPIECWVVGTSQHSKRNWCVRFLFTFLILLKLIDSCLL